MLQNIWVTAFTVSELLSESQQGVKYLPPSSGLDSQNIGYTKNPDFSNISQNELNHHAPRKKVHPPSKSIIERKRFRNKFLKNPTDENRLAYTRQRNFFLKKKKKKNMLYCAKINEKNITDNRKSWQTVKLFFSKKNKAREKDYLGKK